MHNCNYCSLVFATAWDLNIHIRLCHSEPSPWQMGNSSLNQIDTIQDGKYLADKYQNEKYLADKYQDEKYFADKNQNERYLADKNQNKKYLADMNQTGCSASESPSSLQDSQRGFYPYFKESGVDEGRGIYGMFPNHIKESVTYSKPKRYDHSTNPPALLRSSLAVYDHSKEKLPLPSLLPTSHLPSPLIARNHQLSSSFPTLGEAQASEVYNSTSIGVGYLQSSLDSLKTAPSGGFTDFRGHLWKFAKDEEYSWRKGRMPGFESNSYFRLAPEYHKVYQERPESEAAKQLVNQSNKHMIGVGDLNENMIRQERGTSDQDDMQKTFQGKLSQSGHDLGSHARQFNKDEKNVFGTGNYASEPMKDDSSTNRIESHSNYPVNNNSPVHSVDMYSNHSVRNTSHASEIFKSNYDNCQSFLNQQELNRMDFFQHQSGTRMQSIPEISGNHMKLSDGETMTADCLQENATKYKIEPHSKEVKESMWSSKEVKSRQLELNGDEPSTVSAYFVKFPGKPRQKRSRKSSEIKMFNCRYCGLSFNKKGDLESHISIHAAEFTNHCIMCSEAFDTTADLRKHKKIHRSPVSDKLYECILCQTALKNWPRVEVHMRMHTGERPFKCDICGADFAANYGLKKHHRIHTGDKPFKCDYCPLKFTDKCNLQNHERTHTGEKPFKCEICGTNFALKNSLRVHMMMHTGESPYPCEVCHKQFYRKQHLITHRRVHTGERPYVCLVCRKAFSRNHHLTVHVRQHTGEKPYQCEQCDRAFPRKNHLDHHKKQQHNAGETLSKIKIPLKQRRKSLKQCQIRKTRRKLQKISDGGSKKNHLQRKSSRKVPTRKNSLTKRIVHRTKTESSSVRIKTEPDNVHGAQMDKTVELEDKTDCESDANIKAEPDNEVDNGKVTGKQKERKTKSEGMFDDKSKEGLKK